MGDKGRRGPNITEALRDWRTAYGALTEARVRRERIERAQSMGVAPDLIIRAGMPASPWRGHSDAEPGSAARPPDDLSAAVLAEEAAVIAEDEAHERFRIVRQRVIARILRPARDASGSDPTDAVEIIR